VNRGSCVLQQQGRGRVPLLDQALFLHSVQLLWCQACDSHFG